MPLKPIKPTVLKKSLLTEKHKQFIEENRLQMTISEMSDKIGVVYSVIHTYLAKRGKKYKRIRYHRASVCSFEVNGFFDADAYAKIAII